MIIYLKIGTMIIIKALDKYPQIGNYMKRNYLNPNNKSSVKQFAKTDKLQTMHMKIVWW